MNVLLSLSPDNLNLHNLQLANTFNRNYPPKDQEAIKAAVSGAWEWLRGQGYLGQRPGSADPNWMTITPQGRKWCEETVTTLEHDTGQGPAANDQPKHVQQSASVQRDIPPKGELKRCTDWLNKATISQFSEPVRNIIYYRADQLRKQRNLTKIQIVSTIG